MKRADSYADAVIVGGGFYGCYLALFFSKGFKKVLIIEKEADLLTRASYINQARIHNGYHYPRSLLTAARSALNFPRFLADFSDCIDDSFEQIYAISRQNSKVTSEQFKNFCERIGSPLKSASLEIKKLFDPDLIEDVFSVKEVAFDAVELRNSLKNKIKKSGIEIRFNTEVEKLAQRPDGTVSVFLKGGLEIISKRVYNTTYSQINNLLKKSNLPLLPFKHEITEVALVKLPAKLKNLGITVMDGPFFSTMPFPSENLHSLTHVRYTPHQTWDWSNPISDTHAYLKSLDMKSNYLFMVKDAQRYIPLLKESKYVRSLYEVKTVLTQNEVDDGRPILYKEDHGIKNLSIIMGGKIDNIYDIIEAIKQNRKS